MTRAREPGRPEPWTDDVCEGCERCNCVRHRPYEPPTVERVGTLRDLRAASDSCLHPGRPPWCP